MTNNNLIERKKKYLFKSLNYLKQYGFKNLWNYTKKKFRDSNREYREWYAKQTIQKVVLEMQRDAQFEYMPLISILVPVYNTPFEFLEQMINSVRHQTYSGWELCIANASPENKQIKNLLNNYIENDSRIKVIDVPENEGISQNTNLVLQIATGDYVGLLDHDDLLAPNALYEVVQSINKDSIPDVIYTDEDKVSFNAKEHFQPNFKPDFNLDLLRSNNYICHFFLAKRKLVKSLGGFREEFNGAQDYDLILRCIEKARKISHVPKILYHWRMHNDSTSNNPVSKAYAYNAGKRAIEEHLARCSDKGWVEETENPGFYKVKYELKGKPLVSIVVLYRNGKKALSNCLQSISELSYMNYEILVIKCDNINVLDDVFVENIKCDKIKVLKWEKSYNFAAVVNWAISQTKGDYILLLSDCVQIISSDCIELLLSNCMRKQMGIVGGKTYYSDNTIHQAGIVIGKENLPEKLFAGYPDLLAGYMHRETVQQNLSIISSLFMMIKREVYKEVEGFNEKLNEECSNIDFCLKVGSRKYLLTFVPSVKGYYYGQKDTLISKNINDLEDIYMLWEDWLKKGDPAYNPNLSFKFSLRKDEEKDDES